MADTEPTSTEPTTTEAPAEPATTEAPVEPATEPTTTETPAEPATTEEAPVEPATEPTTTETPAEPTATEEAPVEPATTEEAPTTTEAPVEPATTEEAPTTTEAPVEPAAPVTEEAATATEPTPEPMVVREPDPQPEDQPSAPILNNLNPDSSFPLALAYAWGRPLNAGTIPVTMYRFNFEGDDGTNMQIDLSANVFKYTFYNLSPYVTYTGSVRASSNNGEGLGPRSFYNPKAPVSQVFSPPATAEAIVIEPDCIAVQWTAPSNPPLGTYKYEIYCINDAPMAPTYKGQVESVQFIYQFDNLDPRAGYNFYVRVVNNVSASQPTYTQHVDPRV
jgi:hypothetical protein